MKNYYEILGIKRDANHQEIRNAYKNLALKYHPDKNKLGEEQFKLVSEAYQILRDPIFRSKYDMNENIEYIYQNPKDIWKSFFPDYISEEVLDNILKTILQKINDDLSFDRLYTMLMDKFTNQYASKNTNKDKDKNTNKDKDKDKIKNIFINVLYDIQDHYELIFKKKVYVEMESNNNIKTFHYNIDTRNAKYLFVEKCKSIGNNSDIKVNINLNIMPNLLPNYKLIDSKNLLYTLNISLEDYNKGIYINHDLFGNNITILFETPIDTQLLYVIYGKGIPVNKDESGDLYFRLVINETSNNYYKVNKCDNAIKAIPICFF